MKKYEMAVKTGVYQTNDGEKKRYENVGEIHSAKDGGFYARINPFRMLGVAMAAIARGEDSMLVSLFEPRGQEQRSEQAKPNIANKADSATKSDDDFDDDIPF